MALNWTKKVDGVDDVKAKDVNDLAGAIQDLEANPAMHPYINSNTGHWMIWNATTKQYEDSGMSAYGGLVDANVVNSLNSESTSDALAAAQGKILADKVTEVKQSDAQKLPLTGGTLSGALSLHNSTNATAEEIRSRIADSTRTSRFYKQADDAKTYDWGTKIEDWTDGANSTLVMRTLDDLNKRLNLYDSATTAWYRLYGEHNITVSQSAPPALAEGCQHQVY